MFVLRFCFIPETARLLIATLGAWLYALVSGWQPPVVRAAGGFTLFLVGRYFFRRRRVLNLLAAVALMLLIFDPLQLYDTSFQLSFLSVAVIGALAAPILDATSIPFGRGSRDLENIDVDLHLEPRIAQWRVELRLLAETLSLYARVPGVWLLRIAGVMLRVFFTAVDTVMLSAVIQVGLALPMILYFHRVSLSGLSANVLIVPILNVVIPVGFLAIFTGWHWPAALAAGLLRVSESIAAWHVRWEPLYRMPDPPLWLSVAFCASLVLACLAARIRWPWRMAAIGAVIVTFTLLIVHPFAPTARPGQLELTMIDVGQGDSLLVALPDGRLMLVDGGGIPTFGNRRPSRMDIGEDVVSPYLWHRGIRRLDTVAMTHAHADHCGGLPAILENFHPRELWVGAIEEDSPDWIPVRDKARQLGIRIVPMQRGDERAFDQVKFRALSPGAEYSTRAKPHNNDSLVLSLTFPLALVPALRRHGEADRVGPAGSRPGTACRRAEGAASWQPHLHHTGVPGTCASHLRADLRGATPTCIACPARMWWTAWKRATSRCCEPTSPA